MEKISPLILRTPDCTYRIKKKKMWQKKFEYGYAYLLSNINDFVYPYRGEVDKFEYAHQVGIYTVKDRFIVIRPRDDYDRALYSKRRIIELTTDNIFGELKDDIADIPEIVITDGDVFNPPINRNDDIALAGMKYAISQKQIDFNAYANKFENVATKNNGRRALTHGNTLKMEMADRFGDVFDINFALLFWDKEGCTNPMTPGKKKVFAIFNDEEIDLKDDDVEIETIQRKT